MEPTELNKNLNKSINIDKYLESTQARSFFVLAVTFLFVVFFLVVVIIPSYSAVWDQYQTNKKRDLAIASLEQKLKLLDNYGKEIDSKQSLVTYFQKVFPSKDFVQQQATNVVYTLAGTNRLVISSLSYRDLVDPRTAITIRGLDTRVSSTTMQLRARGDRVSILSFIQDLEQERTLFNINTTVISKLDPSAVENSEIPGTYEVRITIQVYYWDSEASRSSGSSLVR